MFTDFISIGMTRLMGALFFFLSIPYLVKIIGTGGYGHVALFQVYSGFTLSLFAGVHSYILLKSAKEKKNSSIIDGTGFSFYIGSHLIAVFFYSVFIAFLLVTVVFVTDLFTFTDISVFFFMFFSN